MFLYWQLSSLHRELLSLFTTLPLLIVLKCRLLYLYKRAFSFCNKRIIGTRKATAKINAPSHSPFILSNTFPFVPRHLITLPFWISFNTLYPQFPLCWVISILFKYRCHNFGRHQKFQKMFLISPNCDYFTKKSLFIFLFFLFIKFL